MKYIQNSKYSNEPGQTSERDEKLFLNRFQGSYSAISEIPLGSGSRYQDWIPAPYLNAVISGQAEDLEIGNRGNISVPDSHYLDAYCYSYLILSEIIFCLCILKLYYSFSPWHFFQFKKMLPEIFI